LTVSIQQKDLKAKQNPASAATQGSTQPPAADREAEEKGLDLQDDCPKRSLIGKQPFRKSENDNRICIHSTRIVMISKRFDLCDSTSREQRSSRRFGHAVQFTPAPVDFEEAPSHPRMDLNLATRFSLLALLAAALIAKLFRHLPHSDPRLFDPHPTPSTFPPIVLDIHTSTF
jgi:hypothetical protein